MIQKIIYRLPITKIKITLASLLYKIVKVFWGSKTFIVTRNNINYEIDLTEGIDLSLFLFGNFQNHISNNKYFKIKPNFVIIDIGANIGAMALRFAQLVPQGKVIAFEPTHYAWNKLLKNILLNPELSKRIEPIQAFVSSNDSNHPEIIAYSSWKVGGPKKAHRHPVHLGEHKSAEGVYSVRLDTFTNQYQLEKID